jgi:NAD(P)-dependent dehydrogenase (short-subunit alcohol dehydrogenase family)
MPTSLLRGKHAVVFGARGSIGAAVAREFASEGADVFLSGRTAASVERVAKEIEAGGGHAHAAVVDALDAAAVEEYVTSVVRQARRLDIAFNATGPRVSEYSGGPVPDFGAVGHRVLHRMPTECVRFWERIGSGDPVAHGRSPGHRVEHR